MTRSLPAALLLVVLLAYLGAATPALGQTSEADVYVAQAILQIDERKYEEALANLRKALEIAPDHAEALFYTGVVYSAQRKPAEAIPFLERAHARTPRDTAVTYQLALAYFAQQQYERAEPLLEALYKSDPGLNGLGYYTGFLRYRRKDYRGALEAFRAGRATDVEIQQLTRFYSGLALGVLGLPQQAAAEVEQALRLAPGTPLVGPAERLRDTIVAARKAERRLSVEVRLGGSYDDNVDVRPTENKDEPLVAELRRPRHESFGELFGLRADYVWWKTVDWQSTIGYSFFATYNNDIPKFNVIDHLATVGLSRNLTLDRLPAVANLTYAFDTLSLEGDEFVTRHTGALSLALIEGARNLTQFFLRYQNKDFTEPTEPRRIRQENRDANNYMVGFLHFVRFAEDKHFVKGGYQLDHDETGGANYDYVGHRLSLGGQYTLPWQAIRLKYDFDAHRRDYKNPNSLFPTYAPGTKTRHDWELTNVVRAEVPLPASLTLAAEYQFTRTYSNIEIFDFSRNVFSLALSWSY